MSKTSANLIDLSGKVYRLDGSPMPVQKKPTKIDKEEFSQQCPRCSHVFPEPEVEQATWSRLIVDMLQVFDKDISVSEVAQRGRLIRIIQRGKPVSFQSDTIELMKKLATKTYNPDIVYQLSELLDPAFAEKEQKELATSVEEKEPSATV